MNTTYPAIPYLFLLLLKQCHYNHAHLFAENILQTNDWLAQLFLWNHFRTQRWNQWWRHVVCDVFARELKIWCINVCLFYTLNVQGVLPKTFRSFFTSKMNYALSNPHSLPKRSGSGPNQMPVLALTVILFKSYVIFLHFFTGKMMHIFARVL